MAAARITAEDFEKLPEALQAEYDKLADGTSDDYAYELKVEEVDGLSLEDAGSLRSALDSERKSGGDAAKKLKEWERLGVTPKDAREALKAAKELDGMSLDEKLKASLEREKAQIAEKYEEDLKAEREGRTKAEQQARAARLESTADALLAEQKVPSAFRGLLKRELMSNAMVTEDGKVVVRDEKDPDSPRMTKKRGETGSMTVDEYLVDVLGKDPEWAPAFPGRGGSGSGVNGDDAGGSGGSDNGNSLKGLHGVDKLREIRRRQAAGETI
jgi:hypothetical protein